MQDVQVELTLYVRRESEPCDRAREAVQSALATFDPDALRVRIVDVDGEEARRQAERITTAPVVRLQRGETPPSWLLTFDTETLVRRLRWLGLRPASEWADRRRRPSAPDGGAK